MRDSSMDIDFLRSIGLSLKKIIPPLIWKLHGTLPIGVGASGDKTYLVDKKAEETVIRAIEKIGEPATVISEECGIYVIKGGGIRFLIDPVDGSRNAVSGLPFFSTSIAIVDGDNLGDTIIGYVVNLVNGDEFWALKGKGSYFNGMMMRAQKNTKIQVVAFEALNPKRDIAKILPLLSLGTRTRCLGSTALDTALVAQGVISVFVSPFSSRSFDFASGWLLVKEAGGIITDLHGNALNHLPIGLDKISTLLASGNETIHKQAIDVLR